MESVIRSYYNYILPQCTRPLQISFIQTKLGEMCSISDRDKIYFLRFVEQGKEILYLFCKDNKIPIRSSQAVDSITAELNSYYAGTLKKFTTPYFLVGTPFAKTVWQELTKIPYGQTCSYKDISQKLSSQNSQRAIGNASASNPIAIIIPCHRVIKSDGKLGNYNGGIKRKEFLISHEQR